MAKGAPEAGFTLVEVLVALSIFSLAAIGLAHLTTETTRNVRTIDLRLLAKIEADNQMVVATHAADKLLPGTLTGRTEQRGIPLDWERTIAPSGRTGLVALSVTVKDPATGQEVAARQTLVKVTR